MALLATLFAASNRRSVISAGAWAAASPACAGKRSPSLDAPRPMGASSKEAAPHVVILSPICRMQSNRDPSGFLSVSAPASLRGSKLGIPRDTRTSPMSDAISKTSSPAALAARLAEERPADVVDVLSRNPPRFAAKVLIALPEPLAVEALDEPQLGRHAAIISELPPENAATSIDALSADCAAHIVRELRASVRNDLITRLGRETKATADRLLPYPADCAGGIVTTEFVAVPTEDDAQAGLLGLLRNDP